MFINSAIQLEIFKKATEDSIIVLHLLEYNIKDKYIGLVEKIGFWIKIEDINLPNQNQTPLANPEIEFLDALGLLQSNGAPPLFDPPEIAEPIPSPEAEREYLEALEILEPILQFHQTNIISFGCELLDDHYQ
ncbi:19406_t:CDS:2, partial [Gigaspora margarita]